MKSIDNPQLTGYQREKYEKSYGRFRTVRNIGSTIAMVDFAALTGLAIGMAEIKPTGATIGDALFAGIVTAPGIIGGLLGLTGHIGYIHYKKLLYPTRYKDWYVY